LYTRKKRKDAIPEEWKQTIHDWWEQNTRVYNNQSKTVGKRRREGEHAKHFKEDTNTELFQRFQAEHTEITVGQRTFEMLMPHFIRPMVERLRLTCSCKDHSDMQTRYRCLHGYRLKMVSACIAAVQLYCARYK
jgi:hypothetical protein